MESGRKTNILEKAAGKRLTSRGKSRASLNVADIVHHRSDLYPGRYTCVECSVALKLEESWRPASAGALGVGGGTSVLFCAACADKLKNRLNVEPYHPSSFELLNMGVYQKEFGDIRQSKDFIPKTVERAKQLIAEEGPVKGIISPELSDIISGKTTIKEAATPINMETPRDRWLKFFDNEE